ncbi:MAG: hypothetical protein A4S09_04810 [Proteobacteria bacterium SG_bin7]|nr:MAG: hypothetical protein A4S09_04810 [Proteobacteria bacterium SG_bin7]
MRKLIILLLIACSVSTADTHQAHLQKLKKEFPYGLLTDDFGILNMQDLKINTCIAGPIAFSEQDRISPYPYWQCFEIRNTKMTCERGKYDPHEKAIMSMLAVSGVRDKELHEFISRRPIPLWSCRLYKKDWQRLTKNETHICVSGADHSKEVIGTNIKWTWIFGRYKTRKGCDSYFQGECADARMCED